MIRMTIVTSVSLLQRVRRTDDQSAWSQFVDLYGPLIFEWGRRAGLTETDATDLSQDVLIQLLVELPKFDYSPERGRFRGWLRTVTVNKCRELHRRKSIFSPGENDRLSQFEDSKPGREFWEIEYHQYLVAQALLIMQAEFETHVWQAAWKQIVDEQKPADVATDLGISLTSVYQSRSRVVRQLRDQMRYLIDED